MNHHITDDKQTNSSTHTHTPNVCKAETNKQTEKKTIIIIDRNKKKRFSLGAGEGGLHDDEHTEI